MECSWSCYIWSRQRDIVSSLSRALLVFALSIRVFCYMVLFSQFHGNTLKFRCKLGKFTYCPSEPLCQKGFRAGEEETKMRLALKKIFHLGFEQFLEAVFL